MTSFQFDSILLYISDRLSVDELSKIKFLCRDMVGKRELEQVKTGTRLFQILTERGRLAMDKTDCVCQLLRQIERHDLSDKLSSFESQSGSSEQPDSRERAKLDAATEVISENLSRNWRKLGRKLGLTESQLESVSRRHPTEQEEIVMEMLKEWRKKRGAEAQTEELITALRACQFNLTADKVQDRLEHLGC